MTGSDIMLVTCVLTISLSFPYLVFSMFFTLSLPFVVNGRPSKKIKIIVAQTFGSNGSLRYENLVTGYTCTSAESISALNWLQNCGQPVWVLLNFVITSFDSFALIDCFVLIHCSLLFRFFRFSSTCISYVSFCSNFSFSNCISSWYFVLWSL